MGKYDEIISRKEAALDEVGGPERFLTYDGATGVLTWKPRGDLNWDKKYAGRPADARNTSGYIRMQVTTSGFSYTYLAHRVAFRIAHGRWPAPGFVIHHINAVKDDNRIANLEEVTHRGNVRAHHGTTRVRRDTCGSFYAKAVYRTRDRHTAEAVQRELNAVIEKYAATEHKAVAGRAPR